MASKQTRITQLDGLRAIAILAVFLHHAFHVALLWMGVDLFFVLSGFLITGILVNRKQRPFGEYIGHFYARRARRILPPYLLLLILTAVLLPGPWMKEWFMYAGAMNFILPLRMKFTEVLTPLWSLAVEEQFYLLWPLAVYWLNPKPLLRCAVGLLVLAPVLRFVCTPWFTSPWPIYMLLPFRMDALAAGALLALLWPAWKARVADAKLLRGRIALACMAVFAVSFAALIWLQRNGLTTHSNTSISNLVIFEATLGMMTSVFVASLVGFGRTVLDSWPAQCLGRISYTFYLVHLPALELTHLNSLYAAALSLGYAVASWLVLEKPILSAGRPEPAVIKTVPEL